MLFCMWFRGGCYNHIFGSNVDPLQLMVALRMFIGERNEMITRYEQDERNERQRMEREQHPPITWEEYCERRGISKQNPLGLLFD